VVRGGTGADDLVEAAVARRLRHDGHEVVVAAPGSTAEQVAEVALQEDADAVVSVVDPGDRPVAGSPVEAGLEAALATLGLDDVAVVVVSAGSPPEEVVAALDAAVAGPPGLGADRDS
jgi:methylmalonyl-CoA mutase cobalamin-binding subunit